MKSIELKRQRAELVKSTRSTIEAIKAENRQYTPEENEAIEANLRDIENLKDQITVCEREEKLEVAEETTRSQPVQSTPRQAFEGNGKLSSRDFKQAVNNWASVRNDASSRVLADRIGWNNVADGSISLRMAENLTELNGISVRTLSSTGSATGAEWVGQEWANDYITTLKYYCPIRNYVNVINTVKGDTFHKVSIDTTALTAAIVAQNTSTGTAGVAKTPATSEVLMYSFARPVYVDVNAQLERDTLYDLSGMFNSQIPEVFGRAEEASFMTGAGSTSAPEGLVTGATDSTLSFVISAGVSYAKLKSLYFSVDRAYRKAPKAAWVMSDTMFQAICGIVDDNGRPLISSGIASINEGFVERIFGAPVVISNSVADGTTNADKCILFGDLSQYTIRDVGIVDILRDPYSQRVNNQVRFHFTKYSDGRYTGNKAAVKYLSAVTS